MTVIEVEGTNVKPLVIDSLEIFVGARYSDSFSLLLLIVLETGQRYSVVVRTLCSFFTQEHVSDLFVGQSRPAS